MMRPSCAETFAPKKRGRRRPSRERAQGRRPGARCTRGLVCKRCTKKRTRAYRFSGGIRPSLRNGFTAYTALSSATNSFCHRRRRIEGSSNPGWARKTSAGLTPATGARTTRFCRPHQRRSSPRRLIAHEPRFTLQLPRATTLPRQPLPAPTFVTMANAPSRDGMAAIRSIRLRETFAYLAVILDGFSRKVVGWALGPISILHYPLLPRLS
jgi:hypothetical protein